MTQCTYVFETHDFFNKYDDVQVPKLEGRMHCGLLHWRNESVVENSWHRHISMVSRLDFDVWTISCIPRILTLNMSMSVAFLCNFTILPQNKLKHKNMKLIYHTTTSYNLYGTRRLSSQLDKGEQEREMEWSRMLYWVWQEILLGSDHSTLAHTAVYCSTGQWWLTTYMMTIMTAMITVIMTKTTCTESTIWIVLPPAA